MDGLRDALRYGGDRLPHIRAGTWIIVLAAMLVLLGVLTLVVLNVFGATTPNWYPVGAAAILSLTIGVMLIGVGILYLLSAGVVREFFLKRRRRPRPHRLPLGAHRGVASYRHAPSPEDGTLHGPAALLRPRDADAPFGTTDPRSIITSVTVIAAVIGGAVSLLGTTITNLTGTRKDDLTLRRTIILDAIIELRAAFLAVAHLRSLTTSDGDEHFELCGERVLPGRNTAMTAPKECNFVGSGARGTVRSLG